MTRNSSWLALALTAGALLLAGTAQASISERAQRGNVGSIDVVVYPMDVKDVVTVVGAMPLGDAVVASKASNPAVPTLAAMLLQHGTTRHDKFAIDEMLSRMGAEVHIDGGTTALNLYTKSLKSDMPHVVGLLAEQLRMPAFSGDELAKAKTQLIASLTQRGDDPDSRAYEALALSLFPAGSPNSPVPRETLLKSVEGVTVEQVRAFHDRYYGPEHMRLVFVGDVDADAVRAAVRDAFAGWKGGVAFIDAS